QTLRHASRQWQPVALTTVLFLALGVLFAASGMSAAIATSAAGLGPAYPAIAPWIGAVGGFITGSNTGASAMFATIQAQTAHSIGYSTLTMVGLQNVGASLATMASPPRLLMAMTVAGMSASTASRK